MNTTETFRSSYKDPTYQAYRLLQLAFIFLMLVSGVDKFFNFLTHWEEYLYPPFDFLHNPTAMMELGGVAEIFLGLGLLAKPKYFSYIVAFWLMGIIINLLFLGKFFDVVMTDTGLVLSAFAFARLSSIHDH